MRAKALIAAAIATVALAALAEPSAATSAPPTIENQWVSDVTSTDATLNATINPNGLLTKYKLQIDTTGNFDFFQTDGCPLHPPAIVCAAVIMPGERLPPGLIEPPESSLSAAYGGQHVSVNLATIGATLQPDTTYHFRAIAASGFPIVEGPDLTFTTPALPPSPPSIERTWVTDVSSDDATLHAEIDPHGADTEYQFFLSWPICPPPPPGGVSCMAIGVVTWPLPAGTVPASETPAVVDLDVSDTGTVLLPGREYHYWVEAANEAGSTQAPEQTFTTLVAEEEEPVEEEPGVGEGPPTEEESVIDEKADPGDSVSATMLLPAGNQQSTSPPLGQPSIALGPIKGRSQGSGQCKSARRHNRRMPHRPAVRRACIPVPHARVSRSRLP